MRQEYSLWTPVQTRFRDLDPMNHVNSAIYFTYLEAVRTLYFKEAGIDAIRKPGQWGIPVVSQTCNYREQLYHPSVVDVGVRCVEIREKTAVLEYGLYLEDTDKLIADGSSVSAWVDLTIPRAVPIPDELRESIAAFEGREFPLPTAP